MSDVADRYARARLPRRWWVALAVALALVGGGWLVWTAAHHATPPVAGRMKSFEVASDTVAKGVLTVDRRDASTPVRCTVIAQAVTYERVGEITIDVPPASTRVVDLPIELRTYKRATSVSLDRCEVAR